MGPGVEAFLVGAVAALGSVAASIGLGRHWPARRVLARAQDDAAQIVHELHGAAWPCACWEDEPDDVVAEVRAVRPADDPARPDPDLPVGIAGRPGDGETRALSPAVQTGADPESAPLDVPRPGGAPRLAASEPAMGVLPQVTEARLPSTVDDLSGSPGPGYLICADCGELIAPSQRRVELSNGPVHFDCYRRRRSGPGRLPSQDTYRAELARIGRPDPAPWYAALVAPAPPVEPGPPAEPAWLERLLYKGAMSTAWCETFNSREMEVFHAHVDEWDRFIAAWGVEARWVTVGCRAWPPPGLVPA